MRTIAIINQKGGCGKTTVSINLAAVLAGQDRRTLLVDVDPQAHCALGLAVPENQLEYSVSDLLRKGYDGTLALSDVVWQISRNLDLVPSTMELAALEQELASAPDKDRRLAQVLAMADGQYDVCIIDCPPSIGLLTFNALRAADEVIIPVETGYFALQGSVKQKATIEMLARRAHHQVRLMALPTMYDVRTKLAREILSELNKHFGEALMPVVVHFNSKLKEAASFGQPITEYDPASRGMQDFEKLSEWLMNNPPPPVVTDAPEAADAHPAAANPVLSRAAELVERARALSNRTAALAADLNREPELTGDHFADAAAEFEAQQSQSTLQIAPDTPEEPIAAEPEPQPRPANLEEKLAKIYGVRPTSQGLLFIQPERNDAQTLSVAGDFNDWSPTATPLRRDDRLGVWQACIPVPPGRYRYRLVVDGNWTKDPYNTYVEANPFGELNNVVEIGVDE